MHARSKGPSSIPLQHPRVCPCPPFRNWDRTARSHFIPRLLTHYALIHPRICTWILTGKPPIWCTIQQHQSRIYWMYRLFWTLSSCCSVSITYNITTYPALTRFMSWRACDNIFNTPHLQSFRTVLYKTNHFRGSPSFSSQLSKIKL